jgi:hypothetical protein
MIWLTEIQAVDPETGVLCKWSGPRVEADTKHEAYNYLQTNGLGYCRVLGKLIVDIDLTEHDINMN